MDRKIKALFVINKKIPENDYRFLFVDKSKKNHVLLGMPDRPRNLNKTQYVRANFREGLTISNLREFFSLGYFLYNNKTIDVVHFSSTILILFGPVVAKFIGVPALITVTGLGRTFDEDFSENSRVQKIQQYVYKTLMRLSVILSKVVLFQNRGHQSIFEGWYPKNRCKFKYIGSATDAKITHPVLNKDSELVVVFVARIMPSKGISDFLQVASSLHKNGLQFELIGPPSIGCERTMEEVLNHDKHNIIQYFGELDSETLAERYVLADILFFPSYGEGLSRVMLEAGFNGLCPIAYDIDANKDLISDGRGFLRRKRDIVSIIALLKELNDNRNIILNNAINYQNFIVENYSIKEYVQKMDSVIQDIFN